MIEPLGLLQIIRLRLNHHFLRVRSEEKARFTVGEQVFFGFKQNKLHIFDQQTEEKVW